MGMEAHILAIGKFSPDISHCLEYGEEEYIGVEPGALVVTHFCPCVGSTSSRELADALGVSCWNFNTHHIKPEEINWEMMHHTAEHLAWGSAWEEELKTLIEHKFALIFIPNG